jgi:pyruvate kinase
MTIYLNDGKQKLKVTGVSSTEVHTTILSGGTIRGRRGLNMPDADLSISSITPKDKRDIVFGLSQKPDFITLSFVRNAKDIQQLRQLINKNGQQNISIVAKIETKQAVENIEEIVAACDVIMVARGDLAIEIPPEKVPLLQKQIILAANLAGKPVITATQMLDSMRTEATPTRAEVSDIANAILDGTDAVMLSDETAVGDHPDRAVEVMSRVAREVELDAFYVRQSPHWDFPPANITESVSQSVAKTAEIVDAKAIVVLSETGYAARMVSRYRPHVPVLVITPHLATFNRSLLTYGCKPILTPRINAIETARETSIKTLKKYLKLKKGDIFIMSVGNAFGKTGTTNMMMVERI